MTHDRHPFTPNSSTSGQALPPGWQVGFFLFLIPLLAIPLLQPLFTTQISCGFDTVFHLWRAVQAGALLDAGILFSRWAPHMAHGYGYPLFLYQSPFSAQLTAVLHALNLSWPVALNVVYGLGVVASGWTMWWLARTFWGNWGGLVAAVAYLYAPFHAYVAFYRASLSETVAWSLPPLVLWGLYRWQQGKSRWGLGTAVFSFILLVYTHDVTAYAFLPLFVGWILLWGVDGRSWQVIGRGGLALLLGMGGSAFFWLPAIAERSAIQFGRASSAWPFLYFNNFLPLDQLLALPRSTDPGLLNDWPPRALGSLLLIVALAGAGLAWRRAAGSRWLVGFLLAGLAGYLFLTVSWSEFLWTAVPQLAAFQFPWRFLAPASFLAAFLCGGFGKIYPQITQINPDFTQTALRLRASAFSLFIIVVLSVGHWGWLYPDLCDAPDDLSLAGMVAWEQATQTLGSTASGELLPRDVEIVPDPANPPAWEARLDPSSLPPGAQVLATSYQPLTTKIELDTAPSASSGQAVPFRATLRIFNFPGWRVTVNGRPVPIIRADPEGWITVPVPDGRATIQASFGETPLRQGADGVSLVSVILLLGFLVFGHRYSVFGKPSPYAKRSRSDITNHQLRITVREAVAQRHYGLPFTVALLLIAAKLLLVDAEHTPLRQARLQDGALAGVARPLPVTLGTPDNPARVRLLGLEDWATARSGQAVPADEPLTLTLYWQALQPLAANYKVGLTLLDENGVRWSDEGLRDYRWLRNPPPTSAWPTDRYARTAYFVDMLPGTPPGDYRLQLSFFEEGSLTPLTFYSADGRPLGPQLELGTVTLAPPDAPWPAATAMQYRLDITDGTTTLLGSNLDRTEAAPGDPLLVTLFWSAKEASSAALSLVDEAGEAAANWPVTWPDYGAGAWRSQLLLRLPVFLENGRYQWQLTFANGLTVSWGELTITAPDRLLTMPAVATAVNISLSEQASLVGFTLADSTVAAGETIELELVWQALREMSESYRVFVHLLAADGRLVAQSDGLPANWTRPTTGWLPGEFIRDAHSLALPSQLPPGDYTLVTGLYLPNGSRLQQPSGQDYIPLTTITIP